MIANLFIFIDFREKLSSFFARERRLDVGWDEGEWLRSFSIFLSVWQMSFSRNINDFREKTTKKREESLLLPSYRITNIDVMKGTHTRRWGLKKIPFLYEDGPRTIMGVKWYVNLCRITPYLPNLRPWSHFLKMAILERWYWFTHNLYFKNWIFRL